MTGFLLAVATLTKFYPALFLLAVVRRRDYALLVTFCVTIVVSYIPYFLLGHGQVLGFLGTYASEGSYNGGVIPLFMDFTAIPLGVNKLVYYCTSTVGGCADRASVDKGGRQLYRTQICYTREGNTLGKGIQAWHPRT
ncbi:MAG: DUF2029 domain-containing protein [Ktedonobacteraceae bacterium]|nr:DUF2029 domain-containing protein [Ktedonobacteraceae bacterium]